MLGTTRTLIANAITGQTSGFALPCRLPCGTRVKPPHTIGCNGCWSLGRTETRLARELEYSHTVYVIVPEGIEVTLPIRTIIVEMPREPYKVRLFSSCSRMGQLLKEYLQGVFVDDEKINLFMDERCLYIFINVFSILLDRTDVPFSTLGFETLLLVG